MWDGQEANTTQRTPVPVLFKLLGIWYKQEDEILQKLKKNLPFADLFI